MAKEASVTDTLDHGSPGDLENLFDAGLRHKTGARPEDYLRAWLKSFRLFGYATQDDSWGELEKEIAIALRRLVVAERRLRELGEYR